MKPYSELENMIALQWSPKQGVFHHQPVKAMLEANWATYFHVQNHESDWLVVGIVETDADAEALRTKMIKMMDEGQQTPFHLQ